jgi:hypothetical protein
LAIALIFIVILVSLFVIARSSLNNLACEGQPINIRLRPTVAQQIWGETTISQSFVAPRDGLNRLDLLFQTYQRQNTHDIILTLRRLPPGPDDPLLATKIREFTFNAAGVRDQTWRSFTFPAIPDSAGKTYLISIQSPESVSGNAITVGGTEWDVYEPGSAYLGSMPVLADVAFRTCYELTTLGKLQLLFEQMTRDRPGLWGNIVFYALLLLVYVALLVGLFLFLGKLVLERD